MKRRASATCLVTADVHYAAAHDYHPTRATFTDFDPFWEFVAGPLHAGTFAPGALDPTFGPETSSARAGWHRTRISRPATACSSSGWSRSTPTTRAATVTLHNRDGKELYRIELAARTSDDKAGLRHADAGANAYASCLRSCPCSDSMQSGQTAWVNW